MNGPRLIAIVDTSVFLSGLLSPFSSPRQVLERFRDHAFTLGTSPELLGELIEVVTRPPFRSVIPREVIQELLDDLRDDALFVHPMEYPRVVLTDPDDDKLFACALAANADCLVSLDHAVLAIKRFGKTEVLRPREFLAKLAATPS